MKHIIYQAFTRLWGEGKFSDWDDKTLNYLKTCLCVDYIWFTGIPRHASSKDFVKGDPGCPYAVSDWFDTNPYLALDPSLRMEEFDALVQRCHNNGLKVLIDFIPNHVAKDYTGEIAHFDYYDGDWSDTLKVDWSSPQTFQAMLEVLRFWALRGVDGFRCDMVELVDARQLRCLIHQTKACFPDLLFVAEVYEKSNYLTYIQTGYFDLLYDKSGLYDTLVAISENRQSVEAISWNWQSLNELQPKMLNFLENHDEVRRAIPSVAGLSVSLLFNDASFLLYFGQEVGEKALEAENRKTSIFNWTKPRSISHLYDYLHSNPQSLSLEEASTLEEYVRLLRLAALPEFSRGQCWDLCYCNKDTAGFNAQYHFAFMRYTDNGPAYIVAANFASQKAKFSLKIPPELSKFYCKAEIEMEINPQYCTIIQIGDDMTKIIFD